MISIIIPVLNEEKTLAGLLQQLQPCRAQGHEVIVVDGGSEDNTVAVAATMADKVLSSTPGRARQMNRGAAQARHDILWFMHADTVLPAHADKLVQQGLAVASWGRFDICLSGSHSLFRLIEFMINMRSAVTGIATGDQGIFVKRSVFDSVGGYADIPLMEDIVLSRNLRRVSRPVRITAKLVTSSRRWEKKGILKTVLLMWWLRLLFWLGVRPEKLVKMYY